MKKIIFLLLIISSCKGFQGVFTDNNEKVLIINTIIYLPTSNGGTIAGMIKDINGDGQPDGLDLDGNGVAELLLSVITPNELYGIDVNGDGINDYYLQIDYLGKATITSTPNINSSPVTIVGNGTTNAGFDTNGDGIADNTILSQIQADLTAPTSSANSSGGSFASPQSVTLTCSDNVACNSIAYVANGSTPDFNGNGNGTIIAGNSGVVTITTSSTLRWIARDANGNIQSPPSSLTFVITGGGGGGTNCIFGTHQFGSCTYQ